MAQHFPSRKKSKLNKIKRELGESVPATAGTAQRPDAPVGKNLRRKSQKKQSKDTPRAWHAHPKREKLKKLTENKTSARAASPPEAPARYANPTRRADMFRAGFVKRKRRAYPQKEWKTLRDIMCLSKERSAITSAIDIA